MRKFKKIFAFILAVCLVFSSISVMPVQAAEEGWVDVRLDDENIVYDDAWTIEMVKDGKAIDSAFCYTQGAAATLTFYGTGIRWYGQTDTNFGEAIVKIDGVEVATKNVNGTAQAHVLHYENTGLTEGTHTISIEPKATGSLESGVVDIEKFEVLSSSAFIPVSSIEMSADAAMIYVGNTTLITTAILPFNATNTNIVYTSSDESIATVNANGLVTGIAAGTVTITGTVEGTDVTDSVEITVKAAGEKSPLRMVIDNENPLFLHHLYLNRNQVENNLPGPLEGGKSIRGFWDALVNGDANGNELPENLKDKQVLIIHAGGNVQGTASTLEWYEARFEETVEDQIPFVIMVSNSGTGNSNYNYNPPATSWVSEMYDEYPNMMGVIFSENHNATSAREARSEYMNEMVLLAAEKGGYVFYSDMNDNGDYVETVLDDQTLFNTLKANKDNFVLLAKTTSAWSNVSYNSHESVAMGAWMADIAGNWGSLIDSWMWFIEGFGPLYGDETFSVIGGAEECRGPVTFPELLFEMRMIQQARAGATVFTFEHPDYSTGIGMDLGENIYFTPAFTESIMKAMEYMTEYEIPTKDEVLETTKVTYAAKNGTLNDLAGTGLNLLNPLYGDTNHNGYNGTTMMTYSTGRYGTIPSLPELATAADEAQFENVLTKTDVSALGSANAIKSYFDELYPATYTGTGYAHYLNNTWYTYNSNWNIDSRVEAELHEHQYVNIELANNDKSVNITFDPYTTVLVDDQKSGEIKVKFNNYLVDKNEIWDGYNVNSTQHWDSDNNQLMYNWIMSSYIPDAETNDDNYRQATIVIEDLTAEPVLTVAEELVNKDGSKQADAPKTAWNEAAGTYTIELSGNGWMEFTVALDGDDTPKPPAVNYDELTRLSGGDRFSTSFEIADEYKKLLGVDKFETVVVATGWNYADALSGSYLAVQNNAPILLTDDLNADYLVEYLEANLVENGTVYILGGTGAVSADVADKLLTCTENVVRVKGGDRIGTNLEILKKAGIEGADKLLVATGWNFADSLSASAVNVPILLVDKELTQLQKDVLGTLADDAKIYVLGGDAAVSKGIEAALGAYGTVARLKGEGTGRYGTSTAIAKEFFGDAPNAVTFANAWNFPDGLCGGPVAAKIGAPVLLVDEIGANVAKEYAKGAVTGYVFGGTGRVKDETVKVILGEDIKITEVKNLHD